MAEHCLENREIDFAMLMRAHDGYVRSVLRRRGVHGADIDDLSQQVWLVAFTHFDQMLASPVGVRRWLSEVARRRVFHVGGTPWNCRTTCVEPEDLAELAIESGSRIEAAVIVSEMLGKLSERYRGIVELRGMEWEIHEIAELHGLAWSTVDSIWRRTCAELSGE